MEHKVVGELEQNALVGPGDSLTREQAARVLHVSPTYIDELIRDGRLAYLKTGSAEGQSRPQLLARGEVLRCWREIKEMQAKGLDNMVQASERLGLYDDEQVPLMSTPLAAAPLNDAYLAQARSLPGLLERLLNATPPDSLERCELVARIENLLELFESAADDLDSDLPDGSTQ